MVAGTQLAPILPDDTFGRLVRDLRANDVTVIVDLCGAPLKAALAVGAANQLDFEGSLRLAAAAGVLNISRHGLGTGRLDAIVEIAEHVELVDLRGS